MKENKIVDLEIDIDFLKHWLAYTFQNDPKISYLEMIILENGYDKSFFVEKVSDNEEIKEYKRLIKNILSAKGEGYNNFYALKNIVNDLREKEDKYKKTIQDILNNPLVTKEQFSQLLEEKIKEQITIKYVDKIIDILVTESKKLKNLNTMSELTLKFNNVILSYLNSISNIITKYNSLDLAPDKIDEIIKKIEDEMNNYTKQTHEIIPTGFETLDKEIYNGGFQKSRLYLIAGKTGFGKSVFLVNLTKNFLKQGKSVLFFTLENTLDETRDRLISCITGIKMDDLLLNEEKRAKQLKEVKEFFKKYKGYLHIEHLSTYTLTREMMDVFVKILISQGFPKPDVVIVDYLDLMKYPQKTEQERIRLGKLTQELKKFSQEHNCVVISPTQLNRDAYKKTEIDLDSISESSMKAHFQDSILILSGNKQELQSKKVEIQIRKNRHGKTHLKVLFDVDFDIMRFTDTGKFGFDLEGKYLEDGGNDDEDDLFW